MITDANLILLFIACCIGMTLYWERDAIQRLGQELVAIVRGSGADRRRKRALLFGLALATILIGVVIATSDAREQQVVALEAINTL